MKPASIGPPSLYLGEHLREVDVDGGTTAGAFSLTQHVQAAVRNVENYLRKLVKSLKTRASNALPKDYRPEIDVS